MLLFDYFHTSMSAGVSSIQTLGLDTKLPEMLMASHQAGKVQPVSKYFTQKLMYKAHGKLFLRDVCGKCNRWELSQREGREKVSALTGFTGDSAALALIKCYSHSSSLHSPYHSFSSAVAPHTAACCHSAAKQQAGHAHCLLFPQPPALFPLQTTQSELWCLSEGWSHSGATCQDKGTG